MLRSFECKHHLVFFQLEHKNLSYVVAKTGIVPKDASDKVLADELVPVNQMLKVNFK